MNLGIRTRKKLEKLFLSALTSPAFPHPLPKASTLYSTWLSVLTKGEGVNKSGGVKQSIYDKRRLCVPDECLCQKGK